VNPAEQTVAFCSALFDDLADDAAGPLFATVWGHGPGDDDRITRWLPVGETDAIAAAVGETDARPGFNTYLGMGVSRQRLGQRRRMRRNDVDALTCVWAEIDIAGEAHAAANLPTDVATARRVLTSTGLEPSLLWHSGHGLQAAWLLDEPWIFGADRGGDPAARDADRDRAAALLRDWRASLAVHAHAMGRFKIDPVHNLDRVLRVPGTTNRKRVEVRGADGKGTGQFRALPETQAVLLDVAAGRRYSPDDLSAAMVDAAVLETFAGITRDAVDGAARLDLAAVWRLAQSYAPTYQPPWLVASLEFASETFRDIWASGHPDGDSETDMSIARHIANIGGTEADAVEAIYCYRLRTGRKLDKVDPARRTSYVVGTVDRAFSSARAAAAERERLAADAAAALAAQDQAREQARLAQGPVAVDDAIVAPPDGSTPRLAEMTRHRLEHAADLVVSDDAQAPPRDEWSVTRALTPPTPPAASGAPGSNGSGPADPATNPAAPSAAVVDIPAPPRTDVVELLTQQEGAGSDGTGPSLLPPPNPWGTRTQHLADEMAALTAMLLVDEGAQFWRLLRSGRGAKSQRRVQVRLPVDFTWSNRPPEGYRPGFPLNSGWWPANAFDGARGFIRAVRQDLLLRTRPVTPEQFDGRFSDSLMQLWEPDDQAGSLANVALAAISTYLATHAPSVEWHECAASGTPYIRWRSRPLWSPAGEFEVWVRWPELCRFVRAHYAQQVTPQVSAELVELSHSVPAPTGEQAGQWYVISRGFLTEWMWAAVMTAGREAAERRSERNGIRLVGGAGAGRTGRR
jgi:hypothetical protein